LASKQLLQSKSAIELFVGRMTAAPPKLPIEESATRDRQRMMRRPFQRQLSQAAKWHQGLLAGDSHRAAETGAHHRRRWQWRGGN